MVDVLGCDVPATDSIESDLLRQDPCFFSASDYAQSRPGDMDDKILEHLAHRIQRVPADLAAHLQRLKIYHQHDHREGLYGSLLDLFIALGDNGSALRLRLLRGVAARLTKPQLALFKAGMQRGLLATNMMPLTRYSRLSAAVSGSLNISEEQVDVAHVADTALIDEVRDLLNSGQIETAQKLLEQALQQAPQQGELSLELLMIYRHTENRDAFRVSYKKCPEWPQAVQTEWHKQAEAFDL
ncbi:MAG: hypothetical protein L3J62_08565 [Gammaproteobacteria bacterium]|nr:hypothetical protein [Gammaproteobacteria bacterium]MCF6230827.1 hypothetical protein [Gammaproteobacteria bacterium]